MKIVCCLVIMALGLSGHSQDYQKEINEKLWKPFIKASAEFDGETFMSLQSNDLVRVSLSTKEIHNITPYKENIIPNFKRIKEEGKVSRTVEVRFLDRIISSELAYESGYFKSTTTLASGEVRTRYTRFYFVLRKENDDWKILVDSDSNEGGSITEEMFASASSME